MAREIEFKISREFLESNKKPKVCECYRICLVCGKKFEFGDEAVLILIQNVKKGFGNSMAIPIHKNCYWVKN